MSFLKQIRDADKLEHQKSVILKHRADNVSVILFQRIHIVIPGDIYAKDSESGVHKPDHCWNSPVAYLEVSFIEKVINFTGGELVSGQEEIEHNLAYPAFIPAKILY